MIGESGSGKSISCKALTGLNPERLHVTGDIYFENQNLMHLSKRIYVINEERILRW